MNKQKKTYILLAIVLVIWGLIGYQIYKRFNPTKPKLKTIKMQSSFIRKKNVENSFYELQTTYRDPFLGKFPVKKKVVKKRIEKPKKAVRFPKIIYNGMIEGSESPSFILTVKGKQEILKKGEIIQEVKLITANSEEAIVSYQGIKKTILKQ